MWTGNNFIFPKPFLHNGELLFSTGKLGIWRHHIVEFCIRESDQSRGNDSHPPEFVFYLCHAEAAKNDGEAVEVMHELAGLFNSVQKVRGPQHPLIRFKGFYNGNTNTYLNAPSHEYSQANCPFLEDNETSPSHESKPENWPFLASQDTINQYNSSSREKAYDYPLSIAKNNPVLFKIFRLLKNNSNWDNLYRIYEIIDKEHNEKIKNFPDKLKNFKHTAKDPRAAGDGARHGVSSEKAPKVPMPLHEAESLIYSLINHAYPIFNLI